ncbi:Maf family protein [Brevibacterium litoralis]|uniref:Maf family protein n=1 Tax=Brevibacterium litoralis TaxID=3138935 RepID=UPI0032ED9ED1
MTHVVLASTSPSRREILARTGITPQVAPSGVEEDAVQARHPGASVAEISGVLAAAKGAAVVARILTGDLVPDTTEDVLVLLASDSVLEVDGRAVGKPHTAEATRAVWRAMGGRVADLWTGHHVVRMDRVDGAWTLAGETVEVVGTRIHTVAPSPAELEAYIATEEPFEVAGALTIDGYGGALVERIEGDHLNVIGLSLPTLRKVVTDLGVEWFSLWDMNRG